MHMQEYSYIGQSLALGIVLEKVFVVVVEGRYLLNA